MAYALCEHVELVDLRRREAQAEDHFAVGKFTNACVRIRGRLWRLLLFLDPKHTVVIKLLLVVRVGGERKRERHASATAARERDAYLFL